MFPQYNVLFTRDSRRAKNTRQKMIREQLHTTDVSLSIWKLRNAFQILSDTQPFLLFRYEILW